MRLIQALNVALTTFQKNHHSDYAMLQLIILMTLQHVFSAY